MSDSPQKGETKDGKPFDYFYLAIEPFVQGMDSFWDDYQRAMSGSDEDHNQDEPNYPPEQSSDVSDFEEDIPF